MIVILSRKSYNYLHDKFSQKGSLMICSRIIHCEDAIKWLNTYELTPQTSFVTSLPDISEFPGFDLFQWKEWFSQTAQLILGKCPSDGVTIFYQSDIKVEGTWIDKSYLCQKAAEITGHELLWHKIVCRSPAGIATYGRPSYSHILCFSKNRRLDPSLSTPDVLPEIGDKTWQRGMGLQACLMIARFIATQINSHTLVNPFCGEGSMIAAANAYNLNAVGIDKSPKRAQKARTIKLSQDKRSWVN